MDLYFTIWSGESRLRVGCAQERGKFFPLPLERTEMIREGQMGKNWMATSFIYMMSMEVVMVITSMAPRGSFYITVSWNIQVCSHLDVLLAFRTFYCSVLFTIHVDRFININCLTVDHLVFSFKQLIFINLSVCIVKYLTFSCNARGNIP